MKVEQTCIYPASKLRQLAKKLESSKANAHHIKQASSNTQAAQVNLLCHQHTELAQKKKKGHKCKQHFKPKEGKPPYKKHSNPSQAHGSQNCSSKCGDTRHSQGFSCPAKKNSPIWGWGGLSKMSKKSPKCP